MGIGANIKSLREEYKLTQKELADICKVTEQAVSQWELGKKVPRMGPIQIMSDYFGVQKSRIIDDTEDTDSSLYRMLKLLSPEDRQRTIEYIRLLVRAKGK